MVSPGKCSGMLRETPLHGHMLTVGLVIDSYLRPLICEVIAL
jgi:hypothetical protein